MIRQMFQGGVEELRRKHTCARQYDQRPPDRLDLHNEQHNHDHQECSQLNPEIGLGPPGRGQTKEGEPESAYQRLVLMHGINSHWSYCTAPEISVAMARSILVN